MTEKEVLTLFSRYHYDVYRLAFSYTGSRQDAEDVTQSTFIKLMEASPALEPGKEKAWLFQVAANQSKNLLKAFWRSRSEPLEAAEGLVFQTPEQSALYAAVLALNPSERAVVYLHYYEGYTQAEIAGMLHLSPSGVSMRLHRARKHLKSLLKEEKR